MTIRLLRTLVAIADTRTFSAAADVVNITHAAVSQQMQTLEADMGVALFDRSTRTPELTPIGRQVVSKARQLIADYDNLLPSVLEDSGLSGVIRLGAIGTTLGGLVPQAMVVLRSRFEHLGLHIRPGLTGGLLADLERGNLDAALVTRPHIVPANVELRDLVEEPLDLVASHDETVDDARTLLQQRPYIRFNRNAVLGALVDNWISANGLNVREMMELDSADAILSMVQARLGVSIMPKLSVTPRGGAPLKRVSLGEKAPRRILALAYHKDQPRLQAMDEVFNAFQSAIEDARGATT